MKCANCQAEIPENSEFCLKCGTKLSQGPAPNPKNFWTGLFGENVHSYAEASRKQKILLWVLVGIFVLTIPRVIVHSLDIAQEVNTPTQPNRSAAPTIPAGPLLRVESFSWSISYNYAIAEGEVTNISSDPLKNVQAMGQFYTKDSTFITSADALIDYNPILPGQTSPFKVMATHNPAMDGCRISFKNMFGGSIEHSVKPKPEPKPKAKKK